MPFESLILVKSEIVLCYTSNDTWSAVALILVLAKLGSAFAPLFITIYRSKGGKSLFVEPA